jgi:hypothetical protein
MTGQPTPETDTRFIPPAARNLPLAALDSATRGADMLDARATTPTGRNFLAHALVQLARDGWLRTEPGAGFEPCDDEPAVPTPPQDGPHAPQDGPEAPDAGAEAPDGAGGRQTATEPLDRLRRLRDQLAAEHAKAVAADQAAVQRPDHLRVTPHNGMAAGLEIAIFFADHHLREAGEEAGEQHAARAALIRDQAALDQVRLLIAAHRARLKLADPVLLGKLERVVAQVGELEAAAGERP